MDIVTKRFMIRPPNIEFSEGRLAREFIKIEFLIGKISSGVDELNPLALLTCCTKAKWVNIFSEAGKNKVADNQTTCLFLNKCVAYKQR